MPADRFASPAVTVTFPDPRDYDVLVPMGAPWSVYDDDNIGSWVGAELDLLRRAHDGRVPILGICFGGQALAAALGGAVSRACRHEIGWTAVRSDRPELIEDGPWFEWHGDCWTAPPAARTLARTDVSEQAFVVGRSLAVQFHPELTASMLEGWLGNGGRQHALEHGVDPDALLERTRREEPAAAARARRLVDRFLDQVATQ